MSINPTSSIAQRYQNVLAERANQQEITESSDSAAPVTQAAASAIATETPEATADMTEQTTGTTEDNAPSVDDNVTSGTPNETPEVEDTTEPNDYVVSEESSTSPEDFEGPIRFGAFRRVFNEANTDENQAVGRRELNNVNRENLNRNQRHALDTLLENFDGIAGPGRITLEDLATVASLDGFNNDISAEDIAAAPDQLRGRQLRQQAEEEFGIEVVGDVDDQHIITVINSVDDLPEDIIEQFIESGSTIELHNDLDHLEGVAANGVPLSETGAFALPGTENGTAVISVNSLPDDATGSVDVTLHEVAHVLDTLGGDDSAFFDISDSPEFQRLIQRPKVHSFVEELLGVDTFHSNTSYENFAELFTFYHADDTDRSQMPRSVRRFFRNLEFTL